MADNARGTQRGVNLSNRAGDAPKDQDTDPKTPPTTPEDDPKDSREEEWIVHRTNVVNPETGAPEVKEHRVPLKEWAAYEKEHNL